MNDSYLSLKYWKLPDGKLITTGKILVIKNRIYHDIMYEITKKVYHFANQVKEFFPEQPFHEETDFTILLKDGSAILAKFMGNYSSIDLT